VLALVVEVPPVVVLIIENVAVVFAGAVIVTFTGIGVVPVGNVGVVMFVKLVELMIESMKLSFRYDGNAHSTVKFLASFSNVPLTQSIEHSALNQLKFSLIVYVNFFD
jgi:hypothetical protein